MSDEQIRMDIDRVERVLARALLSSSDSEGTLSVADVRRIAAELDIPLEAVDAALVAELTVLGTEGSRGRLLPGSVVEASRSIAGSEAEVRDRSRHWMARQEGLRLRRVDGPLEVWEKDPSLLAAARSALRLRAGSGRLRETGEVRLAVAGDEERTQVSLVAKSSTPMVATAGIIAGSAVTGLTLALALQGWAWILLLLPILVVGIVGGVATGRYLTNQLLAGLDRALDGIEQGAVETGDSVGEVINDLRGAVARRNQTGPREPQGVERGRERL